MQIESFHYLCSRKHGSSSVGRAPVSKTGCREFEPLLPCMIRPCKFKNYKVLFYFYQLVRLQAQPPFRMLHHASHSFRSIAARTGLQEKVSGRKRFIYGNILSFVHYLHLIHTGNAQFCTLLGRASHPVYIIRQEMRTVRFDTDILPHPVQAVHKFTVNPERRLSARQYHRHRRIFPTSAKISSSDINTPSSCCVSQKEHFRLQPEKRTKTAGVPV